MLERTNVVCVGLLVVGLAAVGRAQDFVGRHTLVAREVDEPATSLAGVTLVVERARSGLRVTRQVEGGATLRGAARLEGGRLEVDFTETLGAGIVDRVVPAGPTSARQSTYRAAYRWIDGALVGRGVLPGLVTGDVRRRIEETATGARSSLSTPGVEVVTLWVTNGLPIADAPAPQVTRALGSTGLTTARPAALPLGERPRVAVRLAASDDRADVDPVLLEAHLGGAVVGSARVELGNVRAPAAAPSTRRRAPAGQAVELELTHDLGATVGVRVLELTWTVDGAPAGRTPLRVYVTLAAPVKGHTLDGQTLTQVRLENAVRWADGASRLVPGLDSLPAQVNDRMRHFVHPADLAVAPAVPDYALDARRPRNYAFLPGKVGPEGRPLAQVLYPACDAVDPLLQFEHYRANYGWGVLEDRDFPGGRCNQQASLLVDVLATLGAPSKVHTLERVGRGRSTGRPVRQYLQAPTSGPWNFHAVTAVDVEGGQTWLYDHSFSPTPGARTIGPRAELERTGGPLVTRWAEWRYDDLGELVPRGDLPLEWRGVAPSDAEREELAARARDAAGQAERVAALLERARRAERDGRVAAALDGYEAVVEERPGDPTARALFGALALSEGRRLFREGKAAWFGLNDDEDEFRAAIALIDRHRRLPGKGAPVDEELRALSAQLTAELQ